MLSCRIRLFRIPESRKKALTYSNLVIEVVEPNGTTYQTGTLTEAIAHLRSRSGARLQITERLTSTYSWGDGRPEERARRTDRSADLIIDRKADDFVVGAIRADPTENDGEDRVIDYSRASAVELGGRTRVDLVDVEIDRPSPLNWWPPLPVQP
jgi:hypothetical protein